jgi:hypothetical protein
VNVAIRALLLIIACTLVLGAVWSTLHGYPPPPPAIEVTVADYPKESRGDAQGL